MVMKVFIIDGKEVEVRYLTDRNTLVEDPTDPHIVKFCYSMMINEVESKALQKYLKDRYENIEYFQFTNNIEKRGFTNGKQPKLI